MMTKEERVNIFRNTVRLVKAKGYSIRNIDVKFDDMEDMKNNTKFYSTKVNLLHHLLPKYETHIAIMDSDCLDAAQAMVKLGLKPAVLNMASFHTPGGGVEKGSAAQEESIFRRTNIFMSLYQFHEVGTNYRIPQREERYPLEMHYGGIYTPNVTVFRKSEDENCRIMDDPFKIDVITLPAVRKPALDETGDVADWVKDTLRGKIKQIFDIALENGNDSIVLSAFGCGAYGTPPKIVAKLFHEVIESDEYKNLFKEIVFAIINLPSTNGAHNPEGNYKPFKREFS